MSREASWSLGLSLQPTFSRHMMPGNVMHQEEPKTPCISEGSENGFKDFLKIPYGI